ncbi:MAG TPA: DNA polymerase III subunit delta' [Candidatus Paceibacterota bacterium]|nr:DNA polymerase III subunit delta' [Candidatus Paceibacterota bacterium]
MSVFAELVGQSHIVLALQDAVKASRNGEESQEMTHAWLFTGPPGSGRSSAAIAFAAALICPEEGCGTCIDCRSAQAGGHADVEIVRTEGLSIKVDEIRELLQRVAWAPSLGGWRVVVMEDADRLTESAANALLKAIEEPGARTVWLLCAPTLFDVLPTIRSRTRHLQLHTPSTQDVSEVLIRRDGISPGMAEFAARVSQGHIGRARHLANDESIRSRRNTIMNLPFTLTSLSAAFAAAATLVELVTQEANSQSEARSEKESHDLGQAWGQGATGRGMATGGARALKELEKEQKSRATRMVRDSLDGALLDLATLYRDVMMVQSFSTTSALSLLNKELEEKILVMAQRSQPERILEKLDAIMQARTSLSYNAAPLLTIEALMCALAQ